MKKLCYVLLYTGDNNHILARIIWLYEKLSKITKKDIFILTDSKKNYEKLNEFVSCEKIYLPVNPKKYSFDSKRYPNMYMKFCMYELSKFGYTHAIYLDSDIIINMDYVKYLKYYEKYILNLINGFAIGRYTDKNKAVYIACCIIANIENDESDIFLSYHGLKPSISADEDLIDEYVRNHEKNIQDIPGGFITSTPILKKCSLFFHTGGQVWALAFSSQKDKTDYLRYKSIFDEINSIKERCCFKLL